MSPFPKLLLCAGIVLALAGCRSAPGKARAASLARLPQTQVENPTAAHPASVPAKTGALAAIPVTHLVPAEEVPSPIPEHLEMDALVSQVQERNPSLQSLVYAWQSAAQKYPQAVSLEDPMFMSMLAPASVNSATTETAYVLEASQKLPWFGKRTARGERAQAEADMAGAQVEDYRQRLVELTRSAYLDYFLVYREQELNQKNSQLLGAVRKTAQVRYRANQVTQQDILQADVELTDLERRTIELGRKQRVAAARINTLLRESPAAPLPPPAAELVAAQPQQDVNLLQQMAATHRADLAAAAAEIREAEAALTLAQKDYYPDFEFFGRYDTFWQPASTQGDLRGQAGLRMNLPIYRNRLQAAYCQAVFRLNQKRAEFEQKQLDLAYEVQAAWEQLEESRQTVELYNARFLPLAEQSREGARANYETSKGTLLELLTAQRRLIEVQEQRQQSLVTLHRRQAELDRVVGQGDGAPANR